MTLVEKLVEAGYPKSEMFGHESDLYVFKTPLTTRIIYEWIKENGYHYDLFVSVFTDQVSGKKMFDIAFQNDDFWNVKKGDQ